MTKKAKKQMSYAELRFYLKQLARENKIAMLSTYGCAKNNTRVIEFYLHGSMWKFECGEDESKVIDFYNEIKNKIGN